MIHSFGSIGRILSVSDSRLAAALADYPDAVGAIRAVRDLVQVSHTGQFEGAVVTVDDPALQTYLLSQLCNPDEERLFAIFTDEHGRFLNGEQMSRGNRTGVTLHPRAIVQRALDLSATGIILAHNHCSGDCRPSAEDIVTTRKLQSLLEGIEIELIDHLVLGGGKIFSIREGELL
ncbi:JAB domain-containing protein [Erythrobacter litoralis]|uniref:JAB domain-containing protein n=1 Tax=Erythrobacter litoralis TaxID=39960 RepID=UPI0024351DB4|nr:JAB domain-containing protein [Erythrobacter litoralis]